ncbi:conserved hypothetical protein [delta proteobacterium NaphS2]|nr:conserved hypothetical protein [delta proteobacterium NaphS2]
MTAFIAKFRPIGQHLTTLGAFQFQLVSTLKTKPRVFWIFMAAFWTFHS